MIVAMAFLTVLMVVLVIMTMALLIMFVVVTITFFVRFVMMVVVTVTFFAIFVVVVVMVFLFEHLHFLRKGMATLHSRKELLAVKLFPWRGDNHRLVVALAKQGHRRRQLVLAHAVGAAEDDRACVRELIVIKFTEILHIYLAF